MGEEKRDAFLDFILNSKEGDTWEMHDKTIDHLGNVVEDKYADNKGFELTDELLEAGCKLYMQRDMKRLSISSKEEYAQYLVDRLKNRHKDGLEDIEDMDDDIDEL